MTTADSSGASDLPILIVGDVHGDLERLFGALRPYPAERWRTIFVGDLVDGREFGVGALRYARDRPNSMLLLGNHEVAMLAALADRRDRGEAFVRWVGIGGQLHDLDELARDLPLQAWLRTRSSLVLLPDGTLVQHADNDKLGQLVDTSGSDVVGAINAAVQDALRSGEYDLLWDLLSPQHVFERQPLRLARWLERTGADRVVHGHTPHRDRSPRVYAGGRAINFDGGLARRGRWQGRGPYAASVGPLPATRTGPQGGRTRLNGRMHQALADVRQSAGRRNALISARRIARRVAELGRDVSERFADLEQPLVLVVVLKGGIVFAADLMRHLTVPAELEFVRAASYGDGVSSSGHVQFSHLVEGPLTGRTLLVVEDIIDSGRTLDLILRRLRRAKPGAIHLITLLDRPARRAVPVEIDFTGFVIPDKFVIGYGLDYAGLYRELPDIRTLE